MGLEELGAAIEAAARAAVAETCQEVAQTAMALCPVDSGRLKASISVGAEDGGLAGVVSASADYAAAVELGTIQKSARPFLQPALAQEKGRMADRLARRIRSAL